MIYPRTPPIREPTVVTPAKNKDLSGAPTARAIRRTSGGIGKKDDSATAIKKRAQEPYRLSAKLRTQSYNRRIGLPKTSSSLPAKPNNQPRTQKNAFSFYL